jgi:polyisoprenoid-binding protein YceI
MTPATTTFRRNSMRSTAIFTALATALGLGVAAAQGIYAVDPVHSNVEFKVRHLMSTVRGDFTDFEGIIVADFENLDASGVELTIKAASIDTKDEKRDEHLRSADFFDVQTYPDITFKSSKITKVDEDTFAVAGILTIRDVSKEITLTVDSLGEMRAMGGTRAGYELSTTIDRTDYGVAWNQVLDTGGLLLSNEVEVSIALEAVKQ